MTRTRASLRSAIAAADPLPLRGRVTAVTGLVVEAVAPTVRLGEVVEVRRQGGAALLAEVVGIRERRAVLLPLGEPAGIGLDADVAPARAAARAARRGGAARTGPRRAGARRWTVGPLPAGLEEWPVDARLAVAAAAQAHHRSRCRSGSARWTGC